VAAALDKEISFHLDRAATLARAEVERLARKLLREHPNLEAFIMAMGLATFSVKGQADSLALYERKYFKPLEDFIVKWDSALGLTGDPMWIEGPDGEIKTEW
jgi:hypothetical protein